MSGGVPAGWVLVPVEPTAEMVMAACVAIEMAEPSDLEPDDPTYFWGCSWMASAREAWSSMIAATPTPPTGGRDADVERATMTLDVFLAAYRHRPDHKLARPIADDDLLTWGDLRTILAALQALGERG